jgi:phospholipase/carboxylesterase
MKSITLANPGAPRRLVVLMHGVGANAADLEPVGRAFLSALPDAKIILPDAPEPFEHGGPGFQWFSLNGITPEQRAVRVTKALPAVTAWIDARRMELGLNCAQLVIGGFSQGAIMALAAAARGFPCGKVVAFSGRLVDPVNNAGPSAPSFFLGHGEVDSVIPVDESRDAAKRLTAAGYATVLRTYRSLPHGIADEEIASAIAFINDISG